MDPGRVSRNPFGNQRPVGQSWNGQPPNLPIIQQGISPRPDTGRGSTPARGPDGRIPVNRPDWNISARLPSDGRPFALQQQKRPAPPIAKSTGYHRGGPSFSNSNMDRYRQGGPSRMGGNTGNAPALNNQSPIRNQDFTFAYNGHPSLCKKSAESTFPDVYEANQRSSPKRKRDQNDLGRSVSRMAISSRTARMRAPNPRKTAPASAVRAEHALRDGTLVTFENVDDADGIPQRAQPRETDRVQYRPRFAARKLNLQTEEPAPLPERPRSQVGAKRAVLPGVATREHTQPGPQSPRRSATIDDAAGPAPRELDAIGVPDETSDVEIDFYGVEDLTKALGVLMFPTMRLREYGRLPFLIRNLRRGFVHRCKLAGVATEPKSVPDSRVNVLYRYRIEEDEDKELRLVNPDVGPDGYSYEERLSHMFEWKCPLCELHGDFNTREMLKFHLQHGHAEVDVSWKREAVAKGNRWHITLVIPRPPDTVLDESSTGDEDEEEAEEEIDELADDTDTSTRFLTAQPEIGAPAELDRQLRIADSTVMPIDPPSPQSETRAASASSSRRIDTPDSRAISSSTPGTETPAPIFSASERSGSSTEATEPTPGLPTSESPPPSPIIIKHKFRAPSPTPIPLHSRSSTAVSRTSYRGSLPARFPTPPPPSDHLGAAAQYPYLPPTDENGDNVYSCRPEGPRLFDLLNKLPLEPFGLMGWAVLDREDHIFDLDNVRDEDKVMLALWNRWIMLHRTTFVFGGYLKGIAEFIDEYWRMIHLGAGWGALRAFLLMMCSNRFLTITEVAQALKHYEEKTGMDYWYREDTPTGP